MPLIQMRAFMLLGLLGLWPTIGVGKDVAFVIGIENYTGDQRLRTPVNDSNLIAQALQDLGYDTVLLQNLTRQQMLTALATLRIKADQAQRVVVYFAGHGVQFNGETYLMAVGTDFSDGFYLRSAIPIRVISQAISDKPRQKILLIDACRDTPLSQSISTTLINPPPLQAGSFLLFSAGPGAPAADGKGRYSPFAQALAIALQKPDRDIETIARHVRLQVVRATGGIQIPWSQSSLLRPVILGQTLGGTE